MSLTTESPFTGLWQAASWRSTFARLCQWLRDRLEPFWKPGRVTRGIQASSYAVPVELLLPHPARILSNGCLTEPSATYISPHGDTADDTAEDISVAIELKFLLPLLPFAKADEQRCKHIEKVKCCGIARARSSGDETALAHQAYELVVQTIQLVSGQQAVTLPDIVRTGRRESDFWATHWIVKKANSAKRQDDDGHKETHRGCHWIPVEICSPKLRWKSPATTAVVDAVLRAMQAADLGIVVNYTCDVHIHVGRSDGRAFGLATLKRLATLLWLAEDLLRAVRDPASPNFHNVHTWGAEMRLHSRLAEMVDRSRLREKDVISVVTPEANSYDAADRTTALEVDSGTPPHLAGLDDTDRFAIAAIWAAQSHLELGRMLSGSTKQFRRLGFNFSSLGEEDERARTGPRTVEFRVLEGTLSRGVVVPWTRICCALVEIAAVGAEGHRFGSVMGCLLREGRKTEKATVEERFGKFVDCLGIGHGFTGAFWDGLYRNRVGQHGGAGKEHF